MSKTKRIISHILQWIFFIPFGVFIYLLAKICFSWSFHPIASEMIYKINWSEDFAGYNIWGPIFIFTRELLAFGSGIYAGIYLVPQFKKIVLGGVGFLWLVYYLLASFSIGYTYNPTEWTSGILLRNFLEMIAQLLGFLVAGYDIWQEQKKRKNNTTP